ncbi:DotA/TraY family protein [Pleomorphomonas oryzae]|uniref:DotA/TraY family protein n=1 Tax=Pleomorphomonas oryzae TaxID=261934 RepID=UPI0004219814|nr:DotA/TraY family protein [Pleomorphomonas oryzae]
MSTIDINPAVDLFANLPATDWSKRMIEAILGTTTEPSTVSGLLGIIASALMLIGVMWMVYSVGSMIIGAARTGHPLPEATSGYWAMMRPTIALGMLVPMTTAGLSGVHYLVKEVATISANLGNAVALQYVENATVSGNSPLPISGSGQSLVYGLVRAEVCSAVRLRAGRTLGETATTAARIPAASGSVIQAGERRSWWTGEVTEAGKNTGYAWDYGPACGSLTVSNPENFGDFGTTRRQAVAGVVSSIRALKIGDQIADVIGRTPGATSEDSETLVKSIVSTWRNNGTLITQLVEQLNQIAENYNRTISQAARSAATASDSGLRQKLVEHIKSCGWPCVGGYYRTVATLNLAASSNAAEKPTVTEPDPKSWGMYGSTVGAALKLVDNQILTESADVRLTADDLRTQADDDADSTFARMIESITQPMKDYLTVYPGFSPDPISDLMNTGNSLIVGAEAAFGIGAAATGTAHFFGSAAGATLDFLLGAASPAIKASYGAGVMLQYVLPIIPWIYVTFSFFAWGLELLVASIAVLIWAFGHLRLDGGSFVDKAQAFGYGSLFVSILLRPATIVAAYVAAISVSIVGLNFLRYSFSFASDAAMAGFTLGISGVLVYGILAIVVQFMAFHYIFRSILTAPERVGQWLGLQISSWRESEGGALIIGSVGGRLSGMGGGLPGFKGGGGKGSAGETSGSGSAGASAGPGASRPR